MINCIVLIIFIFLTPGAQARPNCVLESPTIINFACENNESWILAVGAGIEYGSVADASREEDFELEPGFILHTNHNWGQIFFDGQEAGARFYHSENFNFMLGARYEPGRKEEDDPQLLQGQGDSDDKVMGRAEFRVNLYGNWNLWTGLSSLIGDDDIGNLHIIALGMGLDRNQHFDLELLIQQRFGTQAFINKDFGVTSSQSARNNLAVYQASGGAQSTSVALIGRYDFSPQIKALVEIGFDQYASRLADSPIIQRGQDYESEAGLLFLYLF